MGHHDDCFAFEDYQKMDAVNKQKYFEKFKNELDRIGDVWETFDDVSGWLLKEWAQSNHHIITDGYKSLNVIKGD